MTKKALKSSLNAPSLEIIAPKLDKIISSLLGEAQSVLKESSIRILYHPRLKIRA